MWKNTNDFKWQRLQQQPQPQKVLTMCKVRNKNNEKRRSNISISTFNSVRLFFLLDFSSKKNKKKLFLYEMEKKLSLTST